MDVDRDGKSGGVLDFSEFVMGLFNFCLLPQQLLTHYMFSLYDTDNSGSITPDELKVMALELFGEKAGQVMRSMHIAHSPQSSLRALRPGAFTTDCIH